MNIKYDEIIYMEFDQSWNFFHQLYSYSKKILYDTQQNIYIYAVLLHKNNTFF
jgi:hypothetical protein